MNQETVKLLTCFGGGLGHAGGMCGALTVSVMALNMITGRISNNEKRDEPMILFSNLMTDFLKRLVQLVGSKC
nr:C-GCAxxG-C-C family (seleno)protein [Desulforamulus reducens]